MKDNGVYTFKDGQSLKGKEELIEKISKAYPEVGNIAHTARCYRKEHQRARNNGDYDQAHESRKKESEYTKSFFDALHTILTKETSKEVGCFLIENLSCQNINA